MQNTKIDNIDVLTTTYWQLAQWIVDTTQDITECSYHLKVAYQRQSQKEIAMYTLTLEQLACKKSQFIALKDYIALSDWNSKL